MYYLYNENNIIPPDEVYDVYQAARSGDKEAYERLYKSTIGLVLHFAKIFCNRNKLIQYQEFVSAGLLGFVNSVNNGRFVPSKGKWSTYVSYYIKGHMRYYVLGPVNNIIRLPPLSTRKPDTHYPICYRESDNPNYVKHKENGGSREAFEFDKIDDSEPESIQRKTLSEKTQRVRKAINKLPKKYRFVVREVCLHDRTLKDVGKGLNLSKERIRQIKNQGLRKLTKILTEEKCHEDL